MTNRPSRSVRKGRTARALSAPGSLWGMEPH